MITYATEVTNLFNKDLDRIDATYRRLLRRALHIPATYYTEVLDPFKATVTNVQLDERVATPPPSILIRIRRSRRLCGILKADEGDLRRSLLVDGGLKERGLTEAEPAWGRLG